MRYTSEISIVDRALIVVVFLKMSVAYVFSFDEDEASKSRFLIKMRIAYLLCYRSFWELAYTQYVELLSLSYNRKKTLV